MSSTNAEKVSIVRVAHCFFRVSMSASIAVFTQGLVTCAALIIAIGAQNAFVLRQGILREHVFVVALLCALSDAFLVSIGVAGLGRLVQQSPILLNIARYGGAAFLFAYGAMAARRAWRACASALVVKDMSHGQAREAVAPASLRKTVLACLAFTYLNPHCYLDTVVLMGAISGQFEGSARWVFAAGAVSASFIWFFSLAYGARFLAPLFEKPIAWRVLDSLIALVMWFIAFALLFS
jgi:L-lysine exporter family protein LysE/ArgO